MLGMIFAAFVVGLVVAMPPGPVVISTGQRAIAGGFWNAFTFNMGSILADTVYALLVYFGLAALLADSDIFRLALWVIGGGWLMWLGWGALRTHIDLTALADGKRASRWRNFRSGLLLTLFNPLTVVSWIALAGSFFMLWRSEWPPVDAFGLVAIFAMLGGALSWVFLVALVLGSVRRFVSPRLVRGISLVSGLFLIVYGLSALWSALDLLL
jgi:threonine/homoserine/homoserine lactone efflux protein